MPVEVIVGPPVLVINQGTAFMVTDRNGEMEAETEHGVFSNDTRFVSHYKIFSNGLSWIRLSSSTTTYYAARVHLVNTRFETEDGVVLEGVLGLTIRRAIGEGIHEDLDVTNYGMAKVRFNLEIALRSDFADLFEVKSRHFVRRGRIETHWDQKRGELHVSYANRDFQRRFIYRLDECDSPGHYANGRVTFEVTLSPGERWHSCCLYILADGNRVRRPVYRCSDGGEQTHLDQLQDEWLGQVMRLSTGNEDVYRLYRQSVEDIGGLRLHDHDLARDVWVPAAGVPWFVTIFGRDSLIVGLQTLLVHHGLARGALKKLAEHQATQMDDWRDAEPGKIPHELRFGELAHFHKIPQTPYYGTADATILYLILLHETWMWTGDAGLLRQYRDVALRCLEWIDRYGDLDGDGFQEYRTRSKLGFENMGWKDSGDAVVYPDGTQVKQPKALCELQGYVFDAWMRMAEVFDALGETDRAVALRGKAAGLQVRFEERFWCEESGSYAFGLDPDKRQIKTVASNAGHCLWSGIATPEHAARVVHRFQEPDMWSGWGIRTLSARNPAYNPFSYQRGSVWPHDNGIIAMGFKRYGFADGAARIARDISEAASYFVSHRLPELYAGIERSPGTFPVQYLEANVPQAWAAGSIFHLLKAILGLQADAPRGLLYVDPRLPLWLPDVTLRGVRVGAASLDLKFWREGDGTRWEVTRQDGSITLREEPWRPWRFEAAHR
jgi:glycogen debranching enzyme